MRAPLVLAIQSSHLDCVARPFVERPGRAGWRSRDFARTAISREKDRKSRAPCPPGRAALQIMGLDYPVAAFVRQRFARRIVLRPMAQPHYAIASPNGDHDDTGERPARFGVQHSPPVRSVLPVHIAVAVVRLRYRVPASVVVVAVW